MSEISNTAVIKVAVDADGVETGLRRIEDASAKTGRTLDGLSKADGFKGLGVGAENASAQVGKTTQSIITSIQKATASMSLGAKGSADYYTALATTRGANVAQLKPYLDQLDQVTQRTKLAAQAQKQLDDGTKFIENLRQRAAEIGKTSSELAAMRAEQLGVADAAKPLIDQLRAAEGSTTLFGRAVDALSEKLGVSSETIQDFFAAAAGAFTVGTLVASINTAIGALADLDDMAQKTGSSVESLSRLQKVAELVGQDFGGVDAALSKLAKGMGGLDEDSNKVLGALKRLGVSAKDAAGNLRDPSEVLIEASRNLQNYADGAGKTALANDLLSKSGADLLPYLNDVAENVDKFSGASQQSAANAAAFGDNMGVLKLRVSELGTTVAANVLPALVRFSETVKEFADSEEFASAIRAAGNAVSFLATAVVEATSVIVPAARITAAYYAIFVGVPALVTAAAAAQAFLARQIAAVTLSAALGGSSLGVFNTMLFGTSVAANLASGSLSKLALAGNVLFAAFAGWEIGTYLREQFASVRVAGLIMIEGLLIGWESVKTGAMVAWKTVQAGWDAALGGMKTAFAGYAQSVADGLAKIGAADTSAQVAAYAESLRASGQAQTALAATTIAGAKDMVKAHAETVKGIKANTAALIEYELTAGRVSEATGGGKKEPGKKTLAPPVPKGDVDVTKPVAEDTYLKGILAATAERDSLIEATKAQREHNEEIGLGKEAVAALKRERLDAAAALKEESAAAIEGFPGGAALAALYREQAEALRERGRLAQTGVNEEVRLDGVNKAKEDLDRFLDPAKAQSFGDALKSAFNGAGNAIFQMSSALKDFGTRQAEIDKQKGNAALVYLNGKYTEAEYAQKIAQLNEDATKGQLRGYGEMTGAAAGFFDKQSTGYKTLQAASQTFHAAELAMTLAELVPKGISAVLNQGSGDPYSAFARMATMAAVVTGLGVAIGGATSGGSGGASAADVQKGQGTGTTFGSSEAKSESITRALDLIEKNTYQGLNYSADMLGSLRNIESSLGGLNNLIVGTNGITTGANLAGATGTKINGELAVSSSKFFGGFGPMGDIMGSLASSILGKTTKAIVDAGIQFGGSLDNLQNGVGFSQYASVDTTKKKFFGLSKKVTNSVETQGLDADLAAQFGMIFSGLEETLKGAAVGLGLNADSVTKALDGLVLSTTTLSLKDLKGDDLTAALNAVISKSMDQISEAAFPSFDKFRKVGEGYAETVVRIATDFAAVDTVFASFGKTFGMLGLESIGARERLIDLAGGLEDFSSRAEFFLKNFFSEKEQADALKKRIDPTLAKFGLSTEGEGATQAFRDVVVALDTTTAAGAEAYTALMAIAPAFAEVVKAGSGIFEQRKELLDQLDELTMSPAQLVAKARSKVDPSNQGLFDDVQAATKAKAVLEERKNLQQEYDQLALSSVQLLAQQRAALDESNQGLFDNIQALKSQSAALQAAKTAAAGLITGADDAFAVLQRVATAEKDAAAEAHEATMTAINQRITAETNAIAKHKALSDAIANTLGQLRISGTESQDRASAQAQIKAALVSARAGALPDADSLKGALSVITRDSTDMFATLQDYQRDFFKTQDDLSTLGKLSNKALSVEEQMLRALNAQKEAAEQGYKATVAGIDGVLKTAQEELDVLKGISTNGLTLVQALEAVRLAIVNAQNNPLAAASKDINNAYQTSLGRAPDAAGMEFWKDKIAGGLDTKSAVDAISSSPEAKVRALYKEILGREADGDGLGFFLNSGASMDDIRKALLSSPEYKKLRGFAIGTNQVPYDMPAMIHKDERIIPAADNRELMERLRSPNESSAVLAAAVERLTREVEGLRVEARATAGHTEKSARLLDRVVDGDALTTKAEAP